MGPDAPRIKKLDARNWDSVHDGAGSPMSNYRGKGVLGGTGRS